jgi:hypothetical protein
MITHKLVITRETTVVPCSTRDGVVGASRHHQRAIKADQAFWVAL